MGEEVVEVKKLMGTADWLAVGKIQIIVDL